MGGFRFLPINLKRERIGCGEMAQTVKCLPQEHKDPSLISSTHAKSWMGYHVSTIPALRGGVGVGMEATQSLLASHSSSVSGC